MDGLPSRKWQVGWWAKDDRTWLVENLWEKSLSESLKLQSPSYLRGGSLWNLIMISALPWLMLQFQIWTESWILPRGVFLQGASNFSLGFDGLLFVMTSHSNLRLCKYEWGRRILVGEAYLVSCVHTMRISACLRPKLSGVWICVLILRWQFSAYMIAPVS